MREAHEVVQEDVMSCKRECNQNGTSHKNTPCCSTIYVARPEVTAGLEPKNWSFDEKNELPFQRGDFSGSMLGRGPNPIEIRQMGSFPQGSR